LLFSIIAGILYNITLAGDPFMVLNRKERITRAKRISEKNLRLRNEFWPDIDPGLIYDRKKEKGFTTVPRTMPLILLIIDELSNKKPVSKTFLSLWCRNSDEGLILIRNQKELAFEAGFTGERAETTWRLRMKTLIELGFIDAKPGPSGDFHYILIFHTHKIIENLKGKKALRQMASYNSYFDRLVEVGASNSQEVEA
jgi:hypothetical protein